MNTKKKKFLFALLIAMSLVSCKKISRALTSTNYLEREVKEHMQEEFAKNGEPVLVLNLNLNHDGGEKYSGTVTLKYDGSLYFHDVDVVYDGEEFVWLISE